MIGLGEATGDTEETGGASGGSVACVGRSIGEITGESNDLPGKRSSSVINLDPV